VLVLFICFPAVAQDGRMFAPKEKPGRAWVRVGLGVRPADGLMFSAALQTCKSGRIYTLAYSYSDINPDGGLLSTPEKTDWTVGLLYGLARVSKTFIGSVSIGGGLAGGTRDFKTRDFGPSPAFISEAQATLALLPFLAFSLHVNMTLHKEDLLAGIVLSANLGKFMP
jgi:hypothetical protein